MKSHMYLSLTLYFFILIIYLFFASLRPLLDLNTQSHFNHFAYALLNGSLSFITLPPDLIDLIFFNNKVYIFSPPAPVIFVIPFVALFGLNVSSSTYTILIGSINPVLVYWLIYLFAKTIKILLTPAKTYLVAVFYALGTTHFYESILGRVWDTGQIFSQTFILLTLLFFTAYELTLKRKYLILFFALYFLSMFSRNHYLLVAPGFVLIHYSLHKLKLLKLLIIGVLTSCAMFIGMNILYNYIRFCSFFESGLTYHNANVFFKEDIEKYGLFSIHYIPKNLYHHFIHPFTVSLNFPFLFKPDPQGNSVLLASPFFLILLRYFSKMKEYKKYWLLLLALGIAALGTYLPTVTVFSTGWFQFGARYILDITPFLLLMMVPILYKLSLKSIIVLVVISVYIQLHAFLLFK